MIRVITLRALGFIISFYYDDKLATGFGLGEVRQNFGEGTANTLLVYLRNLAAAGAATFGTEGFCQLSESFDYTIGTFVENHRARLFGKGGDACGASFLLWQKSLERKALAGQATGDKGRYKGCCAGQALHLYAAFDTGTDEHEAWVADTRCSCVADECHCLAGCHPGGKLVCGLVLVELVMADQTSLYVVVFEQYARGACVFGEDYVRLLEDTQGAKGDIFEIAYWGWNEI